MTPHDPENFFFLVICPIRNTDFEYGAKISLYPMVLRGLQILRLSLRSYRHPRNTVLHLLCAEEALAGKQISSSGIFNSGHSYFPSTFLLLGWKVA